MAIKQLTVFVQNRQGALAAVTDTLAAHNINLRALSIAETEDFGILRLIVNDVDSAKKVLTDEGYLIKIVDVVGVKIGDAPGKLTAPSACSTRPASTWNTCTRSWRARKSTLTSFSASRTTPPQNPRWRLQAST